LLTRRRMHQRLEAVRAGARLPSRATQAREVAGDPDAHAGEIPALDRGPELEERGPEGPEEPRRPLGDVVGRCHARDGGPHARMIREVTRHLEELALAGAVV